jgi:hypothetical protein
LTSKEVGDPFRAIRRPRFSNDEVQGALHYDEAEQFRRQAEALGQ